MNKFYKLRIATLLWGCSVSYAFTGDLGLTSKMMLVIFIGNTFIMWWFTR